MSNINSVSISGNITRDPELRAAGQTEVLSFSVAVNDRKKVDGEWKDVPNYIDCLVFGGRASSLSKFLSKGSKVACHGKLRWSQWESDGKKRSKVEVVCDEVELMNSRTEPKPEHPATIEQGGITFYDEDVPF